MKRDMFRFLPQVSLCTLAVTFKINPLSEPISKANFRSVSGLQHRGQSPTLARLQQQLQPLQSAESGARRSRGSRPRRVDDDCWRGRRRRGGAAEFLVLRLLADFQPLAWDTMGHHGTPRGTPWDALHTLSGKAECPLKRDIRTHHCDLCN